MIKSITNPVFLRRISDSCCPVCRNHKFVIVVKVSGVYIMTTSVTNVNTYIHRWSHRSKDPMCLSMFEYVCDAPISFSAKKKMVPGEPDAVSWANHQAIDLPPSSE